MKPESTLTGAFYVGLLDGLLGVAGMMKLIVSPWIIPESSLRLAQVSTVTIYPRFQDILWVRSWYPNHWEIRDSNIPMTFMEFFNQDPPSYGHNRPLFSDMASWAISIQNGGKSSIYVPSPSLMPARQMVSIKPPKKNSNSSSWERWSHDIFQRSHRKWWGS